MALYDGSIVFLTDGTPASLSGLPDVARLADSLACRFAVLHLLDRQVGRADDQRITAALSGLPGEPPGVLTVLEENLHPALASLASATGGMLVLLPTRRGALSRLLAGNDYERLLREGPLPVLALPAAGRLKPVARVLFPADLSPRSLACFDDTVALCKALGAELHVLHVYGDDGLLADEQDVARRAAAKSPGELIAIDRERLSELSSRAAERNMPAQVATAEGRAHDAILGYAAANAIDLIVMASHGPRTVEDIFRGSTTVRVIQRAALPVLALRA